MKPIIILVFCFSCSGAFAGDSTVAPAFVVAEMKSDFSRVAPALIPFGDSFLRTSLQTVPETQTRKRGGLFSGLLNGALIGGCIGALTGLLTPKAEPLTRGDQVAIIGVTGTVTGALIGGLIGLLSKK